jgi:DNA-binding NarL/FixJ family response regulator
MRIFIADAQSRVRFAVRVLLQQQVGLEVVGDVGNIDELLVQAPAASPDVLLLDWRLTGPEPADLVAKLRLLCPTTRMIAVSERPEERHSALEAGADGFACKCDAAAGLLAALSSCKSIGATD